jgi:hypothetical protein
MEEVLANGTESSHYSHSNGIDKTENNKRVKKTKREKEKNNKKKDNKK